MFSAIKNLFTAPTYDDLLETRDALTTHRVSIALLVIGIINTPFIFLLLEPPIRDSVLIGNGIGILLWLFTIYLVKQKRRTPAKVIILTVNTINVYMVILFTGGVTQPVVVTLLFLLAVANLLFPKGGAIVYGLGTLIVVSILYLLDRMGFLSALPTANSAQPLILSFVFTLVSVAAVLAIASANYRRDLETVQKREDEFSERNIELDQLRSSLEQRVTERTTQLEKRASQFEAISTVANSIAAQRSVDELLPIIAQLVVDSFGFYHAGIFLLDPNKEFAILVASPTEAGKQMLANGHKLRVGEVGIVGRVASSGEPRIALDTGLDAVHFNNPLLPNTRSEMALPLKVENEVIGVLDVQSDRSQAFTEEDIAIMQVLATQLAIAIQRTRLLQQVEENFNELEKVYGRTTSDSWKSLADSGLISNFGYLFDNTRIQSINEINALGAKALSSGKIVTNNNHSDGQVGRDETAIPIKLRGQSIGVVTVKLREGYTAGTIDTIKLAVERLAGSLESARLFEEARLRADREQAIAQITSSISAANEFDAILRTTVEEIGKSLGQAEVSIQIVREAEEQTD